MFDARIRPIIDPPLNQMGRTLASTGLSPDTVTLVGFVLGMGAAVSIAFGEILLGLVLILLNRLADGLDGAIARASLKTDRGGYLDIVLDFVFYGSIPFAFAVLNPEQNALPATALLLSFYANGSAFLAYAIMAEKRQVTTTSQGVKSLYYVAGIAEGTETIALFVVMCLWPAGFPVLAWGFAAICLISAAARIVGASLSLSRK
ncbi:inner membrane protein YnjF [Roseibium sp. TrichSKD4]|uniref:CDP-alcohol phosphatidyltransferase family protein n=1 Tax=Roseibium sp. TrichSKD4 TaxID=744980 RepID=UPI0001E566BB|nr:CDP-alcohol phosphatidyltransferase family protein [Roseibium sp. TrichSKD4]EFO34310.1 inner membrane protein YnjF [Roseibium sp. TrichSKD4]